MRTFMSPLIQAVDNSMSNVSLPYLAEYFDVSISQIQWVVQIPIMVLASGAIVTGKIGDRFGTARLYKSVLWLAAPEAVAMTIALNTLVASATPVTLKKTRFDVKGMLLMSSLILVMGMLLMSSLILLMVLGISGISTSLLPNSVCFLLMGGGLCLVPIYMHHANRTPEAIVPHEVLKHTPLQASLSAFTAVAASFAAVQFFSPFVYRDVFGLESSQ
ncbi:hypothetical protein KIPB_006884 [Kipferlia bialata]|uniref:Major facilitator superfamily (MFS) profile domain-containing protein n=1 Tax=Kipferlia bialata TaxID=797122 RepID=A0A9K3CXX4_9EUKA|nr:hypothetical protein KIPB_006884 [Kipferlia bialata]|eukprot:g6884.t1